MLVRGSCGAHGTQRVRRRDGIPSDGWTRRCGPAVGLPTVRWLPWLGRPASLNGLRIGMDWPYLNSASSEVAEICSKAIRRLEASGATIKDVNLPNTDLVRSAHMVTIVNEMCSAMSAYPRDQFGYDVRLNLALAQHLKASDYVKAQRLRMTIYQSVMQCFEQVDVIVKPATAITAPVAG